jgi:hypothetical protein
MQLSTDPVSTNANSLRSGGKSVDRVGTSEHAWFRSRSTSYRQNTITSVQPDPIMVKTQDNTALLNIVRGMPKISLKPSGKPREGKRPSHCLAELRPQAL